MYMYMYIDRIGLPRMYMEHAQPQPQITHLTNPCIEDTHIHCTPIPDDVHSGGVIGRLVDSHHKHGGVGRGGGDYDLLSSACLMSRCLFSGGEDTS